MKHIIHRFFFPQRLRDLITFAFLWWVGLSLLIFITFALALGFLGWNIEVIFDAWYTSSLYWGGWAVMLITYGNSLVRKKEE